MKITREKYNTIRKSFEKNLEYISPFSALGNLIIAQAYPITISFQKTRLEIDREICWRTTITFGNVQIFRDVDPELATLISRVKNTHLHAGFEKIPTTYWI